MSKNQNSEKPDAGLFIAGMILCFTPAFVIGFILIITFVIKNRNSLANLKFDNESTPQINQEEKPKESKTPLKCPNCGANIKKNETKCPYCDTNFK